MSEFNAGDAEKILTYDALKRSGKTGRGDIYLAILAAIFIAEDLWKYFHGTSQQLIGEMTWIFILIAAMAYRARIQKLENLAIVAEVERIKKLQGIS